MSKPTREQKENAMILGCVALVGYYSVILPIAFGLGIAFSWWLALIFLVAATWFLFKDQLKT
ncbi:hypothetical protein H6G89_07025 [Oscillatoria sp. FACHB-1407]|uniref:hypothetical protein n=1 Tax=Oscillatoria sp. FACHB-1407 TaxID=2692847 RepID=UPI001689CF8B|nr:hypothetical protein [Oscillatoria sp. FACHB-1407]MBD2460794.1 hypothetical protein [Oscillatoria sp. FACHB-1407]